MEAEEQERSLFLRVEVRMIKDIHFPEAVRGATLDGYLSNGWYRMGQIMFTTDKVIYLDKVHNVHWLRYHIPSLIYTRTHRKILSANSSFSVDISAFKLTGELENLYEVYRRSIPFDPSSSVEDFLFGGSRMDVFNSKVITLRDGGVLIAAGVFDIGEKSMAGIMNFYDPAYKKYSPGKYMMLLKTGYARENGIEWYYPGYLMEGNSRFEYKLFLGKEFAEVYSVDTEEWIPYESSVPSLLQKIDQWNEGKPHQEGESDDDE